MRFRLGVVVGFGAGYYLGTRAGRERFEDINRLVRKVRRSEAFDTATDKAKAVVDLGVERAKDVIDEKIGHNGADSDSLTGTIDVDRPWPSSMDPIVRP
jgi:hypothetical protein